MEIRLDIPEIETDLPQFTPTPLRYKKGRITWKLSGNTTEQNEKIGVHNIQALFLQAFPEFNGRFPKEKNNLIAEKHREDAQVFIQEKIGTKEKFIATIGNSPIVAAGVPYFEGSFLSCISKSFQPWGLVFPEERVDKETGRYIDAGGESWVAIGSLSNEVDISVSALSRLANSTRSQKGRERTGRETVLYNETEMMDLINAILLRPIIRPRSLYVDENGQSWVTGNSLRQEYGGISQSLLDKYCKECQRLPARNRSGRSLVLLYDEQQARSILDDFFRLPPVDQATGRYTDEGGKSWVVANYFLTPSGISHSTILKVLQGIAFIEGRDKLGRKGVLYDESEASKRVSFFLTYPQVDRTNDVYRDGEDKVWATIMHFSKQYGISRWSVSAAIEGCSFIEGRDSGGRVVRLYNSDEVETSIRLYSELPKAEWKTRTYVDENGEWVTEGYLRGRTGLSSDGLKKQLLNARTISGRGANGHIATLYLLDDVLRALVNDEPSRTINRNTISSEAANEQLEKLIEKSARIDTIGLEV